MALIALPTNLRPISGTFSPFEKTAAAAITAGEFLYEPTTGNVQAGDSSTEAKATIVGMALFNADSSAKAYIVRSGRYTGFTGLVAGEKYVVADGTNSGQLELRSDQSTSDYITYCITAIDTTTIEINIEVTGAQAA